MRGRVSPSRNVSQGIFWFLIALTLLLILCEVHGRGIHPGGVSVGWVGVYVLYYVLRSSLALPPWRFYLSARIFSHPRSRRIRIGAVPVGALGDVFDLSLLVALTGGWASPIYLLYLGWAVTLLDQPLLAPRLCLSLLAPLCFTGGALLAAQHPISGVQMVLATEQAFAVFLVSLGASAIKTSLERKEYTWALERHHWEQIRQVVLTQLAHELYTPLSAITTSASLLAAEDVRLSVERQRSLVDVIERNCVRMNLLLDDLLDMWRGHHQQLAYKPQRLFCVPLAEALSQTLSPLLAAKQQHLRVNAESAHKCVVADSHRLEQILVNLLANAQKYSPIGTEIALTISALENEVLFAVHDAGPGVPCEDQASLFDLFYRGVQEGTAGHGAGIGLALAKALVVSQGGRIWVESLPSQGSTFFFTLPGAQ